MCFLVLQGLTGRPGDAGPQGKVGASVSLLQIHNTDNIRIIQNKSFHC